ncbi:DsbA family protein [Streptomyces xanthophaeus]|uniref:DsbA family protein n=1 Tax=Streptomyces xanthophaeus TaxID=67385 RepID=UPI003990092F
MTRPPAKPRIYFSLRSPFSWISLQLIEKTRPEVLETSELLPYWDPAPETLEALKAQRGDYHYTQMSRAKHLYILQDTKRLTRRLGLTMVWPVDRSPRWEVPHLAWLAASSEDRPAVYRTLMEARWGRGEDICDEEHVADLFAAAGLDPQLARAHKDADVAARGVEVLVRAYKDDVFGIPYFKAGSQRFWGMERVGWFLSCYDQWLETGKFSQPDEPVALPSTGGLTESLDADSPGGCG